MNSLFEIQHQGDENRDVGCQSRFLFEDVAHPVFKNQLFTYVLGYLSTSQPKLLVPLVFSLRVERSGFVGGWKYQLSSILWPLIISPSSRGGHPLRSYDLFWWLTFCALPLHLLTVAPQGKAPRTPGASFREISGFGGCISIGIFSKILSSQDPSKLVLNSKATLADMLEIQRHSVCFYMMKQKAFWKNRKRDRWNCFNVRVKMKKKNQ